MKRIVLFAVLASLPLESFAAHGGRVAHASHNSDEGIEIRHAIPLTEADYEPAELHSVTTAFGPLSIKPGVYAPVTAKKIPWSAWWYPYSQTHLFSDREDGQIAVDAHGNKTGDAPLQKYDRIVKALTGTDPQSAEYEQSNLYRPYGDRWAGRCLAWSLASIYEDEPTRPITVAGVELSVADQKALLIKSYEASKPPQHHGQIFTGNWDSIYADIKPDQFHKFIQHELFEGGRPFIIDREPGVQVWNVPVYKVETSIAKDASRGNIFHVTTTIFYAVSDDEVVDFDKSPDGSVKYRIKSGYVGTDTSSKIYTYDLIGSDDAINGEYAISFGVWTGDSQVDHPDYVIPTVDRLEKKSRNTQLDIKKIEKILNAR